MRAISSIDAGDTAAANVRPLKLASGRGRIAARGLLVDLAVVLDVAGLERLQDGLAVLGEPLARLAHRQAEVVEFDAPETSAQPGDRPTAGEMIEDRVALGHPHRVVPREDGHHLPELDPLGLPSQPRQDHRRLRGELIVREVMLGEPYRVEAGLFGSDAEGQLPSVHLGVGEVFVELLQCETEPYVHEHLLPYLAPRRHTLHLTSPNSGRMRGARARLGLGGLRRSAPVAAG